MFWLPHHTGPTTLPIRTPRPGGNPDLAILEFEPGSFGKTAYTQLPYHDIAALELRIPDAMADVIVFLHTSMRMQSLGLEMNGM